MKLKNKWKSQLCFYQPAGSWIFFVSLAEEPHLSTPAIDLEAKNRHGKFL